MNKPISISNLLLGYSVNMPLLPAFSVEASKGEFIAIVGRNGVGKSTLIRTIIGHQTPLQGEVGIFGKANSSIERKKRAKLLAYVPSEQVKIPNLFIRDFVSLARFPHLQWSKSLSSVDWEEVEHSIQLVGLQHLMHRDITTVSDGERQRAMIAFALAQDSNIIVLDEPTAFLDLPNKYEIVNLLANLAKQENKTVIFSTHDIQGAIAEVDTIWLMLKSGFVSGCPEDLVLNNHFNEMLSGSKVMFEKETGVFTNSKAGSVAVNLMGEDDAYIWTERLLNRKGYKVVQDSTCPLRIECAREEQLLWKIYKEDKLIDEAHSLTHLAQLL